MSYSMSTSVFDSSSEWQLFLRKPIIRHGGHSWMHRGPTVSRPCGTKEGDSQRALSEAYREFYLRTPDAIPFKTVTELTQWLGAVHQGPTSADPSTKVYAQYEATLEFAAFLPPSPTTNDKPVPDASSLQSSLSSRATQPSYSLLSGASYPANRKSSNANRAARSYRVHSWGATGTPSRAQSTHSKSWRHGRSGDGYFSLHNSPRTAKTGLRRNISQGASRVQSPAPQFDQSQILSWDENMKKPVGTAHRVSNDEFTEKAEGITSAFRRVSRRLQDVEQDNSRGTLVSDKGDQSEDPPTQYEKIRETYEKQQRDILAYEVDKLRVSESLRAELRDKVERSLRKELEGAVRLQVEREMWEAQEAEREELRDELRDQVAQELRDQMMESMREDMRRKFERELEETRARIRSEIMASMAQEVHHDADTEVEEEGKPADALNRTDVSRQSSSESYKRKRDELETEQTNARTGSDNAHKRRKTLPVVPVIDESLHRPEDGDDPKATDVLRESMSISEKPDPANAAWNINDAMESEKESDDSSEGPSDTSMASAAGFGHLRVTRRELGEDSTDITDSAAEDTEMENYMSGGSDDPEDSDYPSSNSEQSSEESDDVEQDLEDGEQNDLLATRDDDLPQHLLVDSAPVEKNGTTELGVKIYLRDRSTSADNSEPPETRAVELSEEKVPGDGLENDNLKEDHGSFSSEDPNMESGELSHDSQCDDYQIQPDKRSDDEEDEEQVPEQYEDLALNEEAEFGDDEDEYSSEFSSDDDGEERDGEEYDGDHDGEYNEERVSNEDYNNYHGPVQYPIIQQSGNANEVIDLCDSDEDEDEDEDEALAPTAATPVAESANSASSEAHDALPEEKDGHIVSDVTNVCIEHEYTIQNTVAETADVQYPALPTPEALGQDVHQGDHEAEKLVQGDIKQDEVMRDDSSEQNHVASVASEQDYASEDHVEGELAQEDQDQQDDVGQGTLEDEIVEEERTKEFTEQSFQVEKLDQEIIEQDALEQDAAEQDAAEPDTTEPEAIEHEATEHETIEHETTEHETNGRETTRQVATEQNRLEQEPIMGVFEPGEPKQEYPEQEAIDQAQPELDSPKQPREPEEPEQQHAEQDPIGHRRQEPESLEEQREAEKSEQEPVEPESVTEQGHPVQEPTKQQAYPDLPEQVHTEPEHTEEDITMAGVSEQDGSKHEPLQQTLEQKKDSGPNDNQIQQGNPDDREDLQKDTSQPSDSERATILIEAHSIEHHTLKPDDPTNLAQPQDQSYGEEPAAPIDQIHEEAQEQSPPSSSSAEPHVPTTKHGSPDTSDDDDDQVASSEAELPPEAQPVVDQADDDGGPQTDELALLSAAVNHQEDYVDLKRLGSSFVRPATGAPSNEELALNLGSEGIQARKSDAEGGGDLRVGEDGGG